MVLLSLYEYLKILNYNVLNLRNNQHVTWIYLLLEITLKLTDIRVILCH